ncbi:aminoglycoside phosphotransferase family protein [Salinarimonas soli]|uniref:3'-kinase n=1 Tax=Salinarimonas soli TaxID=1638099 RepID=A0A5B2V4S7_9HYPH|nr:aminoglycoside phosphotransferase family protein [Salinarimonas soli]KAA2233149.1 3'-kinase [Salinarimonas soli]
MSHDAVSAEPFAQHLVRWHLTPDGLAITTQSSRLLPVLARGRPAMLKVAISPEERAGAALMAWWNGDGAASVLAHEGEAILLERAKGGRSLLALAMGNQDDDASRIACRVAARLHTPRDRPLPDLVPLDIWFAELWPAAARHGGVLGRCAEAARTLLASPREVGVLHGDMHHGNVLDFGEGRGWLAIDPKGLRGEQTYDFASLLCNPELPSTRDPVRLVRQAAIISEAARLDRERLLLWALAYAGLSAVWDTDDENPTDADLRMPRVLANLLGHQV